MTIIVRMVLLPYHADDPGERWRVISEAEDAFKQAESTWSRGSGQLWLAPFLFVEGRWVELRDLARREPIWRQENFGSAPCLLAQHQGDRTLASALLTAALPSGPDTSPGNLRHYEGLVLLRVAAALALDAGDLPDVRAWLTAHDRWLAWGGVVLGQAEGQLSWAEYYRAAGDLALARDHAERALVCASEPRQPLALLAAHRLLGELATASGSPAEAHAHLTEALALADACAAPYEQALCLLALAELRAATGNRDGAQAMLAEAHAILEPLAARPALARAAALAERLATRASASAAAVAPFRLTTRETEVLRLLAQGLPNAAIADRLSLSRRTVEQHLRSVYDKLGVDNRAAATRVAVERDLT
jgi:ATP/maltotriose-dependent transcriptional regulator MalT